MSFREIIDMDRYEQIVEQFVSEFEKTGIKPSENHYVVIKLPVQSFQGFFSSHKKIRFSKPNNKKRKSLANFIFH